MSGVARSGWAVRYAAKAVELTQAAPTWPALSWPALNWPAMNWPAMSDSAVGA
ncbi:hypothetical protein [Cryobacterium sp. SO1]|uniref:hypothetical protein n=1 Tax=Cryobacterium sp. SO1 TaxID=1897061 RepID=UPI0013EE77E9|nr:hypothetical protein [Cryobacterium sp. SO1]